ncbi:MAG TPA: acyl carrier protein [Micromonosporaceae bacterium]|jgi:acyl carrier protein
MNEQVGKFVIASLEEMNYDVEGADFSTALGPAGVDLESLAIAELGVRIEDAYGVRFEDDEVEKVASMTIGEFVALVVERHEMAGQA